MNFIFEEDLDMKKIIYLFSVIFLLLFLTSDVYATEVFEADGNVNQKGDYFSSRFIAGNNVSSEANVDGISFVAGNNIKLNGKSSYAFIAGNGVIVNENIEKDLFIAGNDVVIGSDAVIGRDVYVYGSKVTIDTNIKRDLRSAGDSINLSDMSIGGDAYLYFKNIKMDKDTVIVGKLYVPKGAKIIGLKEANVGTVKVMDNINENKNSSLKDLIFDFIIGVSSSFVVMIVLFFLIPNTKEKLEAIDLKFGNIFKSIGMGLVVLILVPIVFLIALFTEVLSPISLIVIVLYIIFIYLSNLLIYYIVGNLIVSKFLKNKNSFLALFIGIILVKLIKKLPVIGGLVSALGLFYGMGLIYKYIISIRKR